MPVAAARVQTADAGEVNEQGDQPDRGEALQLHTFDEHVAAEVDLPAAEPGGHRDLQDQRARHILDDCPPGQNPQHLLYLILSYPTDILHHHITTSPHHHITTSSPHHHIIITSSYILLLIDLPIIGLLPGLLLCLPITLSPEFSHVFDHGLVLLVVEDAVGVGVEKVEGLEGQIIDFLWLIVIVQDV